MKRSILWNGFEIKKGEIQTSVGFVPYLLYTPHMSNQVVNIAIHGEGQQKEEWLCFNSTPKLGNLLKESIKVNSPFIAFDLYGHGEWQTNNHGLNILHPNNLEKSTIIKNSAIGIEQAIPQIIKDENLLENPITITSYASGCSVALNLSLNKKNLKMALILPEKTDIKTNCSSFCLIKGDNTVQYINNTNDLNLINSESENQVVNDNWIYKVKDFIYN